MSQKLLKPLLARFGGYILTGGTAAIIDAGGFAILHKVGVQITLAATLSFLAAAGANYVLTSRYVFRESLAVAQWFTFLLFACMGLVLNVSVTTLIAAKLHVMPEAAKVAGIGVAFLVNFTLNYAFVFRSRPAP